MALREYTRTKASGFVPNSLLLLITVIYTLNCSVVQYPDAIQSVRATLRRDSRTYLRRPWRSG